MPHLVLSAIEKRYGAFLALDRLSLSVEKGEFVCFLGPSGCGKTTLLRIIAGLDRQSAGQVCIGGKDLSAAPPEQRDFGIVFQSYALFPNLTVAANVGYGIRGRDRAQAAARVAEMLDLVGMAQHADRYPGQLSGGQQQRVALARALAPSPGLLLLDEPLSALDAQVRLGLRRQIRTLHDKLGLTTIMVTHDQEEALTLADRIVVMNHGRIEQIGRPHDIYIRPASLFIAGFVGAMNAFAAIAAGHDRLRLGGLELTCSAPFAAGETVTVCWRPEDVVIGAPVNPLSTQIEGIEFLGPYHRVLLRARDFDAPFAADFSANLARDLGLACGQELQVGLPADRLHVFPGRLI
jgi:iron(III) transport system ATP-binding protein